MEKEQMQKESIKLESIELLCFDDCNFKVIDYQVGTPLIPPRQENNYFFHGAWLDQDSQIYQN